MNRIPMYGASSRCSPMTGTWATAATTAAAASGQRRAEPCRRRKNVRAVVMAIPSEGGQRRAVCVPAGPPEPGRYAVDELVGDLLVGDDAAGEDRRCHRHVPGRGGELALVVGVTGDRGIDGGEQGLDVRDEFLGDRVGRQLRHHGV